MEMTVREIRKILFDTDKSLVLIALGFGAANRRFENKQGRDFLYAKEDQDEFFQVIDNETQILIWK